MRHERKQKMKNKREIAKMLLVLAVTAMLISALSVGASADCGPKASVTITFSGMQGKFYVTLLSADKSFGPWSAEYPEETFDEKDDSTAYSAFTKMRDHNEVGFFFVGNVQLCGADQSYYWGYYPPDEFKILIYDAEGDNFYKSEVLSQYAFSSYFEAKINNDGSITCRQSYNYVREALLFLGRVALTLAIELLIALPFGYFKAGRRRVIIYANLTTQLLLNLGLNAINFRSGWLAMIIAYLLLEVGVFIVEGGVYTVAFTRPGIDDRRARVPLAWLYAFAANLTSFMAGVGIFYLQKQFGLL